MNFSDNPAHNAAHSMAGREKKILEFWEKNRIFYKSVEKPAPMGDFVFYEGPPTANGRPGIHHVEARSFKDLFPRYKTMRGFRVLRKAGWDTHGLPVELEVEKKLGFKGKKDIEEYGIEAFNKKCKESVWEYKEEWEKMTKRMGFFIDLENPYVTYENEYIESLWWIIKTIHERGFLFKGHKVVPHCPRCGTALSSHEVAQGYKNVEENSVYVKFKLKNKDNEYILAWTTTPWTLPGNVALAVGEDIDYVKIKTINVGDKLFERIKDGEDLPSQKIFTHDEFLIFAKGRLDIIDKKYEIVEEMKGKDLVGLEYEPLFSGAIKETDENFKNAFKVYPADFVSTEDGTGVVHTAVMYGIDDYELGEKIGLPKVHTVNLDGTFNERVSKWQSKFVKEAEKEIVEDLESRGLLFKTEAHAHDYPFCWRCGTPLLYYAKDSWFFKMSALREQLMKNNQEINWIPSHIKEGRFGEWLKDAKDWAFSRERYWGTPVPIWECQTGKFQITKPKLQTNSKIQNSKLCDNMIVIGSIEELEKLSEKKLDDLHKPYIDEVEFKCEKCEGIMKRTPEVMDCWFDSGAMPFAQVHYPFENKDLIDENKLFPADYICEAIDQTRGWFYTLLAVSTLLGRGVSYKNVICLGHVLDKKGQKMSKSKGNVVSPMEMIEKYGADSVRWYMYTINQPGDPKRFDEKDLKEAGKVFNTLTNVLTFYKMFTDSKVGDFDKKYLDNVLDKWIMSKLNLLVKEVTEGLDKYDVTTSARKIGDFIMDLSQWYVRRSRDRFKTEGEDKLNAEKTLGLVLNNLSRIMAPFAPFMAEHIYKEIGGSFESVHLDIYPEADENLIDKKMLEDMEKVRKDVSVGLELRLKAGIKVRQPLSLFETPNKFDVALIELIKDEMNVKEVRIGKDYKLDTEISEDLKQEGMLRELIRAIQDLRKKKGLMPQDEIELKIETDEKGKEFISKFISEIKKSTNTKEIIFEENSGQEIKISELSFKIEI